MEISATTVFLLVICIACLLLFFIGNGKAKKGRLPPGPWPIPFLGNVLQVDAKNPTKSFAELSKKYGSVFTIYTGSKPSVVLSGYDAVKEALVDQDEEFSGRGDLPVIYKFTQGNGIAFTNGEKWKVLRRFAIHTLRDFGMGRRSIEERIQEETQFLMKELDKSKGEPFDPITLIGRAFSNVICSIIFGDRFDYEDKKFLTLIGLINDNFRLFSSPISQMYNAFSTVMDYLPGPHQQIFANFEKLRQFVLERIKEHKATFDPNCPRDFIDSFLLKIEQESQNPQSYFHTDTIVMTTHNLFFAGTETVSTSLRYALLILMKYPEIQAKVHEEIIQVVGHDRSPAYEDRTQMPYTEAVIHEILRFIDVIPLGIPHSVTKDTHFRGYMLPKGTNVTPLLFSVHRDPTQFKNPDNFDPNNFLNEKGEFVRHKAFMAFSVGKRYCLGETLARMEMFVFFTTLLQHFTFKPTIPPEQIDLTPMSSGIGNVPPPYTCHVVRR